MQDNVREYLELIGSKGGKRNTDRQKQARQKNAKKALKARMEKFKMRKSK